ncbi:MAG: PIG-L family deacetylase [Salibacteraceae bacterium]
MRKLSLLLLVSIFTYYSLNAQSPEKLSASELHDKIKKLNFLGSVLYVAAHPDDENTRLISYISNNTHARTAYLSLTRGDGGQNLIGPELRESLGVLRTQELLAARRIDGGEQFFTRANDFGYSKHPDETLEIWNKKDVLNDVIWTIRKFRPDVIVNRFDHRSPGTTHGHHTTSAMLSIEAFDKANDSNEYPDQLEHYNTWQPKRLLFNTSWWFYGSKEKFKKADKSKLIHVDIGTYYPSKGLSNTEIAALSRSQHKCQGFGSLGTRGEKQEYLEHIKGDFPNNNDLFDGIDTSWNRIKGGDKIGAILNTIEANFNFQNPSMHLKELMKAYVLIQNIEDEHWRIQKTKEISEIIEASAGLFLEGVSKNPSVNQGTTNNIAIEVIHRGQSSVQLSNIELSNTNYPQNKTLISNKPFNLNLKADISKNDHLTTPYWLKDKGTIGMYTVTNKLNIGLPETPKSSTIKFDLIIENTPITFVKNIIYKYTDPAKGEIYEPFQIIPKVSSSLDQDVYIFNNQDPKPIRVIVKAGKDSISGNLKLNIPKGWTVTPKNIPFSLTHKNETKTFRFKVSTTQEQSEGIISSQVIMNGEVYDKKLIEINYDHIPKQTILLPSEAKIVKLNIEKRGQLIGYIKGSGDVTVESLKHIGYQVETLNVDDITPENIKKYDAIVVGIRAYNVLNDITFKQETLFNYVKNGGNMIVQYNTSHRLKTDHIAPYPLKLSRDRVTDEFAKVTFINPNHDVLNVPNKITQNDFNGWVQERGLYFPNEWDDEFTPILSMHDKGESKKEGSLLIAQYGSGYYVYTGLSFFREFPAGVSGAYRLFANLVSLGKEHHEK